MQIVKKKLIKIFIDQWKESINSETNKQGNMGNKLRTYILVNKDNSKF